ncbi:monooxygenase [Tessaracoccus sp. MC1865]|uniref:monooxygenase n=1 Tax=Tessaracoccus sp. MC1865 TaxID=2760310 RepID=UPI001602F249|nr:monooxygenase [Tessaracoccus sp. MC1865]MBB1482247.1 monooxygenase [Tessaracoccus sp. MC1865]QTO38280.1 monooxygenase [Tessaracoccus sp. MC1865]
MATLLQIDFPSDGPFGAEMSDAYADLATSISQEPGLQWKIWTENATDRAAGGIYLFNDEDSARAYCDMHTKRLESFGVTGIRARFFDVNPDLTEITRGPVD